jgi:hypothetical protein
MATVSARLAIAAGALVLLAALGGALWMLG